MSESAQRIASILEFPPDLHTYDLDYRPISYWDQPVTSLLATIKAEHQRRAVSEALSAGQVPDSQFLLGEPDEMTQKQLEAIHPSFMGGAYLPDFEDWEVEIARVTLNSTTGDVIAIWAQPSEEGIAFRMVDEYADEGSDWFISTETSIEPLTFEELIEMLVLASNLRWGDGDDFRVFDFRTRNAPGTVGFLSFTSFFYPELTRFFEEEEEKRNIAEASRIETPEEVLMREQREAEQRERDANLAKFYRSRWKPKAE